MNHSSRIRRFLSAASVAVAVFAFCCIYCAGSLGSALINNEIDSIGLNMLSLSADSSSAKLYPEDVEKLNRLEGVAQAYPMVYESCFVRIYGAEFTSLLWGVGENNGSVIEINTLYGRDITAEDLAKCGRVCIITPEMAAQAYGRENVIGKTVEIVLNGYPYQFQVVGIAEASSGLLNSIAGEELDNIICMPYTTYGMLTASSRLNGAGVEPDENADAGLVINAILNTVGGEFSVRDLSAQKDSIVRIIEVSKYSLDIVALISLAVAALGIAAESWSEVNDATREIGIKRALGAGTLSIVAEVVRNTVALTLKGTAVGGALALAAFYCCAALLKLPVPAGLLWLLPFVICVGALLGAACSVAPAAKAARLRPIDSIKM